MTLRYFRNSLQFLNYCIELTGVFQIKAHIGTRLIAHLLWIDDKLGSFQNAQRGKLLNTLVNSSTTYITSARNLKEGNARISRD